MATVTKKQAPGTNWWLWCGHLKVAEEEQFVYALLAPTDVPPQAMERDELRVIDGCTLVVHEAVVEPETGQAVLDAAAAGKIDLTAIGVPLPAIPIGARRTTVEAVLGHGAASLEAYYTLTEPTWLCEAPSGAFGSLLRLLHEELGLDFTGRLSGHLGNLDVVDFGDDEPETPVVVNTLPSGSGRCVEICRRRSWADAAMLAHFRATSGEEVLADELVVLPAGVERIEHPITSETTGFELTLFDVDGGRRRHHETATLLMAFNVNADIEGRTVGLDDVLTKRMQGAGKATSEKARKRTDFDRTHAVFEGSDPRIRTYTAAVRARLAAEAPESLDRFFERTLVEEWGALDHIRGLLEHVSTQSAILVDPFFGEESLLRLLMRLGNSQLELTVVTSWASTHPDTAAEVTPHRDTSVMENVQRLQSVASQLTGLLAPKLRMLNLVRGGEPAFHDRYLLLRRRGRPSVVYLLSNSINGMAVNWPFCMSALTGPAAQRAASYIEGLVQSEDATGQTTIQANFDWRSDAR